MKRILLYTLALFAVSMAGCKKEQVELAFDALPEERIDERMVELRSTLTGSEYGWKANILTGLGSYGFYLNFEDETFCTMLADLTSETSSEPSSSTYRIIWAMNATLSFDTFNYITMLQEPSSYYGGEAPNGYMSDIEFDYVKNSGDSIYMMGKKYGFPLILTQVTKDEQERYLNKGYAESIPKTRQFFVDNENAYVSIDSAGHTYKVGISINNTNKFISAAYTDLDNQTQGSLMPFTFNLDGLDFFIGWDILGQQFIQAELEGEQLFLIDAAGEKHEVLNNTEPIIPLNKAIGVHFSGLRSPYLTYFPGSSSAGQQILQEFHEGLASGATGFTFNSGYIDLGWNLATNRITLSGFSSQTGGTSGWTTTIVYDFEFDENAGTYTLTKRSGPTGGYTGPILDQLDNFLQNSAFKLEYYTQDGTTYGMIKGVDRPEVEMTFQLTN